MLFYITVSLYQHTLNAMKKEQSSSFNLTLLHESVKNAVVGYMFEGKCTISVFPLFYRATGFIELI